MTVFTSYLWNSLYGTKTRRAGDRSLDGGVPVADFLDQVSGSDYAPAYQAAIDAAYTNGIPKVIALPGDHNIGSTIYLDPPGNLRSSLSTPTIFGWQLSLIGYAGAATTGEGRTTLRPTFDNAAAIWIGPGDGCRVEDINLIAGVSVRHPKLHNSAHTGFAISGGAGGSLRAHLSRCTASGFYTGFSAGANNGAQAESNFWDDCVALSCYYGFDIGKSSNSVVNQLNRCQATATFCVRSGTEALVTGGEWGHTLRPAKYASVSAVSASSGSTGGLFTFTATIASPDANWADGVYNCAVVQLPHFGNVPLNITAFNAGTSVATFQTDTSWINAYYYRTDLNLHTGTDFDTELAAATHIYACERITIFEGPLDVTNWRIEVQTSAKVMSVSLDPRHHAKLRGGFWNGDLSLMSNYSAATDNYAHSLAQQSFPFIDHSGGVLTIEDNAFYNDPFNTTDSVILDFTATSLSNGHVDWSNSDIYAPNIRPAKEYAAQDSSYSFPGNRAAGMGLFDMSLHGPRTTGAPLVAWEVASSGTRGVPYNGFLPERGYLPRITETDVTGLITATDLTAQALPQPDGNNMQKIIEHSLMSVSQSGLQNYALAKHAGEFFTYGFTLSVNWNCKGQTPFLNVTGGTHVAWLRAGLHIVLDLGDGSGALDYIITGVYPSFGYVTIHRLNINFNAFPGTKTTVYSGSTIGQQAFRIQKFGRQCEFAALITDVNGQTFRLGDQIWQTSPSAGGSPGWVCTTAGVAGSGAVFKAMANLAA